jgi:predicted nucleic acid-binding protein
VRYLLDSNVVISYLNASISPEAMQIIDDIVDENAIISVVTKMETLGFEFKVQEDQSITEDFINSSTVLFMDEEIVDKTILIRRTKKIKLPDAIIAATAIVKDLILVTNNIKDFAKVDDLKLIDPSGLKGI